MENKVKNTVSTPDQPSGKTISIFSGIERRLKLENYFEAGFPVQYLPKVIFVMALAILYISNTHYSDKMTREVSKIQRDVEDLRADYTTLKAEVMVAGKQSEVAKRVKHIGLGESVKPPYIIEAKK